MAVLKLYKNKIYHFNFNYEMLVKRERDHSIQILPLTRKSIKHILNFLFTYYYRAFFF